MSMREFFNVAIDLAEEDVEFTTIDPGALDWLNRILDRAMVGYTRGSAPGLVRPWYRLDAGDGAKVRAKILTATSGKGIGITDPTMRPGQSVGDWMRAALRENLRHEHVVPLLRAAARLKPASAADLEASAW